MKSGNLLLGLMACAAMCACTDNDIANGGGGNGSQVFEGDVAYMVVNIKEVGSAATKATSNSFSVGTENDVSDIHFYFYDEDGNLVTVSTPTTLDAGTAGTEGEDTNFELTGKKVVVVDLADKIYPSYMVTVINQPSDFVIPQTLEAMQETLVSASGVIGTDGYFTMSTSSYYDDLTTVGTATASDHDACYFATPVSEDNFTTENINENSDYFTSNAVTVYVERLAAKVRLVNGISGGLTGTKGDNCLPWMNGVETDLDGETYPNFQKGITIPNAMERSASTRASVWGAFGSGSATTDSTYYMIANQLIYELDDDGTIQSEPTSEDLYIHFDNWALNATAKQSYMMKNIDSSWDSDNWTGWSISGGWNDASDKRSYWGKSFNYDNDKYTYPTSSSEITDTSDFCLNYISATDITNYVDGIAIAYCAENTNKVEDDGGVITSKNSPAITSILVQATVYDDNGFPCDLVSFDSELYTSDAYLTLALQTITDAYPIYVGSGLTQLLDISYLYLEDAGDGYVKVAINMDSSTLYYNENGERISDSIDPQTLIDELFNNYYGKYANWYKEGQMYYNIPIEHLNDSTEELEEANYGVVRNHYYVVTLNSVNGLGRGINNPDDPIIPQEEPTLYYLGADIQILSWRLVEQGVDL